MTLFSSKKGALMEWERVILKWQRPFKKGSPFAKEACCWISNFYSEKPSFKIRVLKRHTFQEKIEKRSFVSTTFCITTFRIETSPWNESVRFECPSSKNMFVSQHSKKQVSRNVFAYQQAFSRISKQAMSRREKEKCLANIYIYRYVLTHIRRKEPEYQIIWVHVWFPEKTKDNTTKFFVPCLEFFWLLNFPAKA